MLRLISYSDIFAANVDYTLTGVHKISLEDTCSVQGVKKHNDFILHFQAFRMGANT